MPREKVGSFLAPNTYGWEQRHRPLVRSNLHMVKLLT